MHEPRCVRSTFARAADPASELDSQILLDKRFWEFWGEWTEACKAGLPEVRRVLRSYPFDIQPYSRYMERVKIVVRNYCAQ